MRNLCIIACLAAAMLTGCGDKSTGGDETKTPQLYFSPGSATVSVGGKTDVQLLLADLSPSIFAVALQINHNDAVTAFPESLGFAAGTLFGTDAVYFAQADGSTVHLSVSRIQGQASVGGSGLVGTLTFGGRAAGSDTLRIPTDDLHFYDSTGTEITVPSLTTRTAVIICP